MCKSITDALRQSIWCIKGLLVLVLLPLLGCTTTYGTSDFLQKSHFTYPNSNVIPLGPAKGSAGGDCDNPGVLTQKAVEQAISSKGGDLLINYTTGNIARNTMYPLIPYVFQSCESIVEGTAVKMEIGRQMLK